MQNNQSERPGTHNNSTFLNSIQQHFSIQRICVFSLFLCLLLNPSCTHNRETQKSPLLNSERIERQFGSYHVEVLSQDSNRRLSNLYSLEGARKTCRTFAIVDFHHPISEAIIEEHRKIVSGQSLGAVFKTQGWRISKEHRYAGEISLTASTSKVAQLMSVKPVTQLAIHLYDFRVAKGQSNLLYARIAEIHHPDYLTGDKLKTIYQIEMNHSSDDRDTTIREFIRKASVEINAPPISKTDFSFQRRILSHSQPPTHSAKSRMKCAITTRNVEK